MRFISSLFAIGLISGCASTAKVDSLPLTVMANIDSVDNPVPVSLEFTPCKQEICTEAGLGGLKIGGKYAVTYNPNESVNRLFKEYIDTKFFNTSESGSNQIKVELISVKEDHSSMDSGADWFRTPDNIAVTYSFELKMRVSYPDENGVIKTFPTIAKKTITSTQGEIANDLKKGVSDAIGLSIIRFDKSLSKSYSL